MLSRVVLGIFVIGLIQFVTTIFGHESTSHSLNIIFVLVAFIGFAYKYVSKYKKTDFVGRVIIYVALPILIYRACTVSGAWGVTTNWIYLVPVFAALFLSVKEMFGIAIYVPF